MTIRNELHFCGALYRALECTPDARVHMPRSDERVISVAFLRGAASPQKHSGMTALSRDHTVLLKNFS